MTDMSCFLSNLLKPTECALTVISDKSYSVSSSPVDSILIINFDRKVGGVIEYKYPSGTEDYELIINLSLPEGIHNLSAEYVYFMITIKGTTKYCIACYRQIPHVVGGKSFYIQKAVTVVANVPFFGTLFSHMEMATREYFDTISVKNTEILMKIYDGLGGILDNCGVDDLYEGISVKKLLRMFGKSLFVLWKLVLLEKKVIIFSYRASKVSSFILALLSLFPGQLIFDNKHNRFRPYKESLEIYGLPLKFSEQYAICPFLSLSEMNDLKKEGYLIGCTNRLIADRTISQAHVVVNLEARDIMLYVDHSIEKALQLSPYESRYIQDIIQHTEESKKPDQYIRQQFHQYLKELLCNLAYIKRTKAKPVSISRQNTQETDYPLHKPASFFNLNSKVTPIFTRDDFLYYWSATSNFKNWHSTYPSSLSYLSPYSDLSPTLQLVYENGDKYIGSFCSGRKHGQGVLEDSLGNRYEGTWSFGTVMFT